MKALAIGLAILGLQGCAMTKITCSRGDCSMTVSKLGTVKPAEWDAIKAVFKKNTEEAAR